MKKNIDRETIIKYKVIVLLFLIVFFAILYLYFDNTNFGGINNIQEIIKDELLKDKIKKEIKEKFNDINNLYDEPELKGSHKEEKAIDDTTKKIKNVVKNKELDVAKIKPTIYQRFFDRLYFSVITGTTLGYGDIYPVSNNVKILSMIQTLSTIVLILL